MDDNRDTERLKAQQLEREATEEHLAHRADGENESAQHERRAQKAHYLRERLEERERSERE